MIKEFNEKSMTMKVDLQHIPRGSTRFPQCQLSHHLCCMHTSKNNPLKVAKTHEQLSLTSQCTNTCTQVS